ncbi:MAG: MBL fold metallo-hydrolase [Candidatus Heimdallarchaeota archaeon]|nr:MAG: MBL fold metallo-hydrolase [Candidatus Heimdallarchaeota archaeon]
MRHKVLYSSAGIATQILIQESQKLIILFDVGDGIIRDLLKEGLSFPLTVPLYILLTHGHYDHCGGLFSLLGFLRMIGQSSLVEIYYPAGSIEIEGLIDIFTSSYQETIPFKLKTSSLKPLDEIKIVEDVRIVAYKMKHMGSTLSHGVLTEIPALGYAIFKKDEKWLVFTGDTGMNENLPNFLKNAKHAYIEATNLSDHHSAYHLNVKEAQKLGELAKDFTLVHTRK